MRIEDEIGTDDNVCNARDIAIAKELDMVCASILCLCGVAFPPNRQIQNITPRALQRGRRWTTLSFRCPIFPRLSLLHTRLHTTKIHCLYLYEQCTFLNVIENLRVTKADIHFTVPMAEDIRSRTPQDNKHYEHEAIRENRVLRDP
jgi:hypothetical protein